LEVVLNNIVFKLTYDDFEMVLDRKLTDDEKITIYNKFTIHDWSEMVEIFFDVYNIRR
jgi:hypothetical protein